MLTSDDDNDCPLFRNEDTVRRRAWIDRALAGVRDRLKPAEIGETPGSLQPAAPVVPASPADTGGIGARRRPNLYVIRNGNR